MEIDSEIQEIVKWLAVDTRADLSNSVHLHYLIRAIEYADPSLYTKEPKSREENINKQIFQSKAVCYFKRKILNPFEDYREMDAIRKHEHYLVSCLKMQLPPYNNHPPY